MLDTNAAISLFNLEVCYIFFIKFSFKGNYEKRNRQKSKEVIY